MKIAQVFVFTAVMAALTAVPSFAIPRTPDPLRRLRTDDLAVETMMEQQPGSRILASDGIEETAGGSWNVLLGERK
ncbi:unnamed protein product [Phytophthora fragariaefolia]|uniref:Unnamed protein product n=1 Tax=Phytophthora fragariaefolia TaxID=1490495 RepID=A0A9W6X481_9STRA|nr:unnamed protein product [Phytophthora fragariaefolia]